MSDPRPIFVSYRREETRHIAGRIADRIGGGRVFIDIDRIEPGANVRESIVRAIQSCSTLLILIGRSWATTVDNHGNRRLEDPEDFVVLEITAALRCSIRIVPVLVDGASMPSSDELPVPLKELALRNAVQVGYETFSYDVDKLLNLINYTAYPLVDRRLTYQLESKSTVTRESAIASVWWPPRAQTADRLGELLSALGSFENRRWPSTRSLANVCKRLTNEERIVGVSRLSLGPISSCTIVATDRIIYLAQDEGRSRWLSIYYSFPSRCRAGDSLVMIPLGLIVKGIDLQTDEVSNLELVGFGSITIRGMRESGIVTFNRLLRAAR